MMFVDLLRRTKVLPYQDYDMLGFGDERRSSGRVAAMALCAGNDSVICRHLQPGETRL
jgi:hypothetical protein